MDGKILGTPDYQITKVEKRDTKRINDVVIDLFQGKKPDYNSCIIDICILQCKTQECSCDDHCYKDDNYDCEYDVEACSHMGSHCPGGG